MSAVLKKINLYPFHYLKYDITAGLVVFLVAIPLCLGIALASGAPLLAGIISGIVGGIVVGAVSESSVSVSGAAAGLIAVVLGAITQLGSFNIFLVALIIAGMLQILVGILRAGFIADYVPSNVIQGLLCAIGILIIIKQLPMAFTHVEKQSALMLLLMDAAQNLQLSQLLQIRDHINLGALLISVFSLATLWFFDKTRVSFLKAVPGPVVVVVLGVLANLFYFFFFPNLLQVNQQLVSIPVSNGLLHLYSQLQFPDWSAWMNPQVYFYGAILAAVASLETLLNLEAAEKLDTRRRYCSRNRELIAQGLGNTVSGFLGGLPVTSVIVRSSVNIQTGAKTKLATIFHGVLILVVVLLIPTWLNQIPLASLAAILIYVGYKLSKPSIYKAMYRQGFDRFFPFVVTVFAIVFTSLLTGILVGLATSLFFILRNSSKTRLDILNEKHPSGIIKRLVLPQQVSFLSKASLLAELGLIPEQSQLIIDARNTLYVDQDILELLQDFMNKSAPDKKIAVNLLGFKDHYEIHNRIEFMNVTTYDVQSSLQPQAVLDILKEGNSRFLNNKPIHRNLGNESKALSGGQHPIAVVIGCIDSRVPIETVFDMGVGDIFVIRIAGNIVNNDILASVEFACGIAGAKLILVLGHTSCGAIRAACCGFNDNKGHLPDLLAKIQPAIDAERQKIPELACDDDHFVKQVTIRNVSNTRDYIYAHRTIIQSLIAEKKVGLIGAVYDISTATVHFDDHLI